MIKKTNRRVEGVESSNLASLDKNLHHTIDATGRALGRVASEAAKALMGKMSADYTPNKRSEVKVTITNASKLHVREQKHLQKTYVSYSGYPGGLKKRRLEETISRRGYAAPLRIAISKMLPRNTFRNFRLKNLKITE